MAAVVSKAEAKPNASAESANVHAHPRLVGLILEQGSWVALDEMQEMWAGLLASSCTESGDDESDLMFADQFRLIHSRFATSRFPLQTYHSVLRILLRKPRPARSPLLKPPTRSRTEGDSGGIIWQLGVL